MIASYNGHLDVVKTLIEAGANVNHTNKVGKYMHCCYTVLLYHTLVFIQVYAVCHNNAMGSNYYTCVYHLLVFMHVHVHVHVYHHKPW